MNEQDETLQIFFAETEDLLRSAEESLLRLEAAPQPGSDVEELFRAIHTLKSGSAMVGFPLISEYSHVLENLLDRMRSGRLTITKPLITFLLTDLDFLRQMVDRGGRGEPEADPETVRTRKAQLNRFLGMEAIPGEDVVPQAAKQPAPSPAQAAAAPSAPAKLSAALPRVDADGARYYQIDMKFRPEIFQSGQDPLLLILGLSEMMEVVDVLADLSNLPPYEKFDPYSLYISWRLVVKGKAGIDEINDVFLFVKDDNAITIEDVTGRFKAGVDLEAGERPLGEVLLERGIITREDLGEALLKQKKLGEILVEGGKVEAGVLRQVVTQQEESRTTYRKTSVRVDVEKINHLVNLAEEIGVSVSRMKDILDRSESRPDPEMEQELEGLLKINREFQERVSQVRMFPLEGTFRRFQRIARDTAFEQGKRIRVELNGVDTELDKEVIEHITDPLKHLVRNSVDHGMESPEERLAAGKNPEGLISFNAFQKGGMILVQIRDDGRGIDMAKVALKAAEMGILKPGETVGPENLLEFLCRPGFSTAGAVTALSGRGVGMDVVRTEVEKLGGTLSVSTVKGEGTTFTLSLPLTFALMDALHVKVRERSYLIPLWGVVGTEAYRPESARFFGADGRVYPFREEYVPLVSLASLFGVPGAGGASEPGRVLVFLGTARQRFGLLADRVLDPHQVVVKSLEINFKSVKGVAGATIMGDGSLSLVLDLFALEEMVFRQGGSNA